jgi:amino acid transporter
MQWLIVIFIIILLILFLISAGLLTQASTKIGPNTTDPHLSYAYTITTWIAVLTWILVALVFIGIFFYFMFYAETAPEMELVNVYNQIKQPAGLGWISILILIIVVLLVLIVGIFSAIAASNIAQYSGYKTQPDIYRAYEDCAISAILCLGSLGIIIGVLIYYNWPETKNDLQDMNKK